MRLLFGEREAAVLELDLVGARCRARWRRSSCAFSISSADALAITVPAWRIERPECEPPPTLTMSVSPMMMLTVSTGSAEQVGRDLREARLVALAARLRADHDVDPAFRLHRDLGALPRRADRGLDVVGDAEAEQLAALLRLALALLEAVPVGDPHGEVHVGLVGAAVVEHADGVAVRHLLRRHEILAAQLDAVDAELDRGLVHQPLDRERHLGPARAAIGVGRHGVGEHRARAQRRRRNVVGAGDQARALRQRRQRNAERADVADVVGAHAPGTCRPCANASSTLVRRSRPW